MLSSLAAAVREKILIRGRCSDHQYAARANAPNARSRWAAATRQVVNLIVRGEK